MTVAVHFNESHWITSGVSKKTKHNYAGNLESWRIDRTARLLYEREASANIRHPEVDTLLCWVFADCAFDWSGHGNVKLSGLIWLPPKDRRIEAFERDVVRAGDVKKYDRLCHYILQCR